jgi:predicted DNA-binding transcriptional regulator YafY
LHQSESIGNSVASLRAKVSRELSEASNSAKNRPSGLWTMIERAIFEERDLTFDYTDSLGRLTSDRKVKPIRLRVIRKQTLLEAFDRSRDAIRLFFLEKISDCRINDLKSEPLPAIKAESSEPRNAKVQLRSVPQWWLRRHSTFIRHSQRVESGIELELEYWSDQWLVRAILPIADQFVRIASSHISESAFRHSLLSHFSGSNAPIDG